jgi:polysaccharide export outer membrane protein
VIREINGQREIGTVDLTTHDLFNSPYYRLQQNDVVLVEQTARKLKQQDRQELLQQIGIASSIITAIALILNLIR